MGKICASLHMCYTIDGREIIFDMANVFANKKTFKEAFQTRVEQIYGIKSKKAHHIEDILH